MTNFFRQNFDKPQLIPLLFIVMATIVLTSLGVWQVKRLIWKNGLIAEIKHAESMPSLASLPRLLDDKSRKSLEYRKVNIRGEFKYDMTLHMVGRQLGSIPGYFMVTPFEIVEDGRIILVNRGFSPLNKESKPQGIQEVTGIIRPARTKRYFSPENMPEKNIWFYEDIVAMSGKTGLDITPIIVEEVKKKGDKGFPIAGDGKTNLYNAHLGYTITWFSTAIIGIIMFGFYYRKKDKDIKE
ncbi:MAG: SURF1 family protein [Rickettsiales bacterium]